MSKPATSSGAEGANAMTLLVEALQQPFGIKLIMTDALSAQSLRSQLYGVRRRLRSRSDHRFDSLSIILAGSVLRIIHRRETTGPRLSGIKAIGPLDPEDVPTTIGSRGRAPMTVREALLAIDELTNN